MAVSTVDFLLVDLSGMINLGLGLISLTLLTEYVVENMEMSKTGRSLKRVLTVWQSSVSESFLHEER